MRSSLFVLFLLFTGLCSYAQTATVFGIIRDSEGARLPLVNIFSSAGKGAAANGQGVYSIQIPADSAVTLEFSFIGQKPQILEFNLKANESVEKNIYMESSNTFEEIDIIGTGGNGNLISIEPKIATGIPSIRGTVEDLLLQAPVNFTSELSSSYSVRGGS
ncbi:MAG: carboxypeptidase-like regulatory domain-containing protein, partial [Flavobacteriales bacterium]